MQIAILIGDNPYGSTKHFAKGLGEALRRLGVDVRLVPTEYFHCVLADPPDLTCSFSDVTLEGVPLSKLWSVPHLSLLLDPVMYTLHQLDWAGCVDREDVAFARSLGFEQTFFFPHGVDAGLSGADEKAFETVFLGSLHPLEPLPAPLEEAAQRVLSEDVSCLQALLDLGIQDPIAFDRVDQHVRDRDRIELVRAYGEVDVWGTGPWEELCPQARVHGSLDFEGAIEVMRRARTVLCSAPRFKHGLHERLLISLMCGAQPVTGDAPLVRELFPMLPTYRFGQWAPVVHDSEAVSAARDRVLKEHTWDERAKRLCSEIHTAGIC